MPEQSARPRGDFYRSWIAANALAECLGLGTTLALGAWAAAAMPSLESSPWAIVGAAVLAIAGGTLLEGVLLGTCQAWVLRRRWPGFPSSRWVAATAIGAGLAWTIGMIPSSVMSLMNVAGPAAAASARSAEPPLPVILLLAAGMGFVLGPFLGIPQGRVLRPYGGRVGRWSLANSSAWALGMPAVFLGTAFVDASSTALRVVVVMGAATLLAGAVVGAVHGRFLLRLMDEGDGSGLCSSYSVAGSLKPEA